MVIPFSAYFKSIGVVVLTGVLASFMAAAFATDAAACCGGGGGGGNSLEDLRNRMVKKKPSSRRRYVRPSRHSGRVYYKNKRRKKVRKARKRRVNPYPSSSVYKLPLMQPSNVPVPVYGTGYPGASPPGTVQSGTTALPPPTLYTPPAPPAPYVPAVHSPAASKFFPSLKPRRPGDRYGSTIGPAGPSYKSPADARAARGERPLLPPGFGGGPLIPGFQPPPSGPPPDLSFVNNGMGHLFNGLPGKKAGKLGLAHSIFNVLLSGGRAAQKDGGAGNVADSAAKSAFKSLGASLGATLAQALLAPLAPETGGLSHIAAKTLGSYVGDAVFGAGYDAFKNTDVKEPTTGVYQQQYAY